MYLSICRNRKFLFNGYVILLVYFEFAHLLNHLEVRNKFFDFVLLLFKNGQY